MARRKRKQRTWTDIELGFLRMVAAHARLSDVARFIKRSAGDVWQACRRYNIATRDRRTRPLSAEAVERAWERYQAGEHIPVDTLRLWSQESGRGFINKAMLWTDGDIAVLRDNVGRMPLIKLARKLRRRATALRAMLNKMKDKPRFWRCTCGVLARALGVHADTVRRWCVLGYVRHWREGSHRVIHLEDAEWLASGGFRWGDTDWGKLKTEVWDGPQDDD